MSSIVNEVEHLNRIASNSRYAAGVNPATIEYSFKIFSRHVRAGKILELGPAEGVMTERLSRLNVPLTVVDGSELFCKNLKNKFPQVSVIHSLFEEFLPEEKFENIVLGHVLEHVNDPVQILRSARQWLVPGGCVFAAVPNARSIHRQAAVLMGMLETEDTLNEMDRHHGHRRVFNPESFRTVFLQAGLNIEIFGGYWLKPVSNKQIEDNWTLEMLDAFMQLGERYPDIAGELYVLATNHGD